jgi:hypothetical protein
MLSKIFRIVTAIGLIALFVTFLEMLGGSSYAETCSTPEQFAQTVARELLDQASEGKITVGVTGFADLKYLPLSYKNALSKIERERAAYRENQKAEEFKNRLLGLVKEQGGENKVSFIGREKLEDIKDCHRRKELYKFEEKQVPLSDLDNKIADSNSITLGRLAGADVMVGATETFSDKDMDDGHIVKMTAKIIRIKDNKVVKVVEFRNEAFYDSSAKAALLNERTLIEAYNADYEEYPDSMPPDCSLFSEYVILTYKKLSDKKFTLSSMHREGHKIFSVSSDSLIVTEKNK